VSVLSVDVVLWCSRCGCCRRGVGSLGAGCHGEVRGVIQERGARGPGERGIRACGAVIVLTSAVALQEGVGVVPCRMGVMQRGEW
jgi:hypothetical protein